ncbi:mycothiol S-conjugate amidase [Streptomyces badius]
MAKYVSEVVDVLVVTCTGVRGAAPSSTRSSRATRTSRRTSTRSARRRWTRPGKILGVQQEWLGFVDSGLPEGDPLPPLPEGCFALEDPELAAGRLVAKIRAFRPQVITTYDENGGYPHPDHIMTHTISMIAFDGAADAERFPEDEFGPVWDAAEALLQPGLQPAAHRRPARGAPRPGPGVAVR